MRSEKQKESSKPHLNCKKTHVGITFSNIFMSILFQVFRFVVISNDKVIAFVFIHLMLREEDEGGKWINLLLIHNNKEWKTSPSLYCKLYEMFPFSN